MRKIRGIVILWLLLYLCGCSNKEYVRIGESTAKMSLEKRYSMETAVQEADLIAVLEVEERLEEDLNEDTTYFRCSLQNVIVGNIQESTIVLKQEGSSKMTYQDFPMFGIHNRVLVFLKEASNGKHSAYYWMLGANTTLFDVVETNKQWYAVDRTGTLSEMMSKNIPIVSDKEIINDVIYDLKKQDSIWNDNRIDYNYHVIYDLETLINYIQE